jgi:hypothetical protein
VVYTHTWTITRQVITPKGGATFDTDDQGSASAHHQRSKYGPTQTRKEPGLVGITTQSSTLSQPPTADIVLLANACPRGEKEDGGDARTQRNLGISSRGYTSLAVRYSQPKEGQAKSVIIRSTALIESMTRRLRARSKAQQVRECDVLWFSNGYQKVVDDPSGQPLFPLPSTLSQKGLQGWDHTRPRPKTFLSGLYSVRNLDLHGLRMRAYTRCDWIRGSLSIGSSA